MKKQQKTGKQLSAKDMKMLKGGLLKQCSSQADCGPGCTGSFLSGLYCVSGVCRRYACLD